MADDSRAKATVAEPIAIRAPQGNRRLGKIAVVRPIGNGSIEAGFAIRTNSRTKALIDDAVR
jgi:hypothetical protein